MSEENTAKSGTGTETHNTQDSATVSGSKSQDAATESAKTFTQEEVNRLIAKELKPFKEIRSEYERIQQQLKEKEEADLSLVEKLRKQLSELETHKQKSDTLEQFVTQQYEELTAEMSVEDRQTIDNLSIPVVEKIALARRLLAKSNRVNGAARSGEYSEGRPDSLMEQAKQLAESLGVGKSEEWKKAFIQKHYQSLKDMQ